MGLEIERWSSATSTIEAIFHFPWYPSSVVLRLSFAPLFSSCRLNRISKQFITPTPGAHLYPYQRSLVAPCKRLLLRVEPPTSQQPDFDQQQFLLPFSLFLSSPSFSFSLSLTWVPLGRVREWNAQITLVYLPVIRMETVRKGRKNYIDWNDAWNFLFRVIFINFRERYFRVEITWFRFPIIIKSFLIIIGLIFVQRNRKYLRCILNSSIIPFHSVYSPSHVIPSQSNLSNFPLILRFALEIFSTSFAPRFSNFYYFCFSIAH